MVVKSLLPLLLCAVPAYCAMTAQNRIDILDKHNKYRRELVTAVAMEKMSYDMKLEQVAQAYADSGQTGHNSQRTEQYATAGGSGYVGENWYSGTPTDFAEKMTVFVWPTNWGGNGCSEEQNYIATHKNNDQSSACHGGTTGHYTQVMWSSSSKVGCGTHPQRGTWCNYSPGGNMNGLSGLYTLGTKCSACPAGKPVCSDGLCAASNYNDGLSGASDSASETGNGGSNNGSGSSGNSNGGGSTGNSLHGGSGGGGGGGIAIILTISLLTIFGVAGMMFFKHGCACSGGAAKGNSNGL